MSKSLNKVLALALALVMLTGLAACGGSAAPAATAAPAEQSGTAAAAPAAPAETAPAERKPVIIGTSTEPNGDWAYSAFTSNPNATDQDVMTLTDTTGPSRPTRAAILSSTTRW